MTRLETCQPIDIIVKPNGGVDIVEPQLRIAPIAGGSGEPVLPARENSDAKTRLSGSLTMADLYDQVKVRDRDLAGRNAGPRPRIRKG